MLKNITIDGIEYMPVEVPKARTLDSHIYCSRDEGATMELTIRFETQPERDLAFLAIRRLIGKL